MTSRKISFKSVIKYMCSAPPRLEGLSTRLIRNPELLNFVQTLKVTNLYYQYPGSQDFIINGLNFTIKKDK